MHPRQGLKRLLLGALLMTATTTGALAAEKFQVITTFTVIADMAKNVAGDAAEVTSITKPGAEIHEYQPTPGDIKRAQKAQLILAERHESGAVVPALLSASERRAGGDCYQRHHPDGHQRRAL